MKIVIVGDGKVGFALTQRLSAEGHDVVVIDNDITALQNASDTQDVICIQGNGAIFAVQQEAGVDKADLLIAATSRDEVNILCCVVAKKLGASNTIARVRNPEYAQQLHIMRDELQLSMIINPELAAASEITRVLAFPSALNVDAFAKGRAELVEVRIGENNPLQGQPLSALHTKFKVNALVCAVQRDDQVTIPGGDFVLQTGDKITLAAPRADMSAFFRTLGIWKNPVKNVMILGGGRVAYYLTRQLQDVGMQVKIIEMDEARCTEFCVAFPQAMVIHGDGTDQELLDEEGLAEMDAFVALTGIDEENIVISMYARSKGVEKVITKIDRLTFLDIFHSMGIDSVISPKYITADQIVRYVRVMQNSLGSNVETLSRIVNNRIEALEFRVRDNISFLNTPIRQLKLKPNLLIACIIRKGRFIVPRGSDWIESGDAVIVVTTNQTPFDDLSDIVR